MEEIKHLYERYPFNILIVLDELFAVNKQKLEEFCRILIDYRDGTDGISIGCSKHTRMPG